MEKLVNIHIEKLPEGFYLATSDEIPGLVAQGRTLAETLEIARDVARKLIEARIEKENRVSLEPIPNVFDYPLVVGY
ncbi:MAG: type II toxin-antitoxin system HicB family antitoxin [Candidatus Parabeggiatoa sp.]|nr:type II toxin-antitoxin system HicB family antitoxin [Candidatus Parabeggiatoa sp.]